MRSSRSVIDICSPQNSPPDSLPGPAAASSASLLSSLVPLLPAVTHRPVPATNPFALPQALVHPPARSHLG
jgi:hypothetical protein